MSASFRPLELPEEAGRTHSRTLRSTFSGDSSKKRNVISGLFKTIEELLNAEMIHPIVKFGDVC
jgi:hypothetical protein